MNEDKKKKLILELLASKYQEYGMNLEQIFGYVVDCLSMTNKEFATELKNYVTARKAKIDADKNALEAKKLQAEADLTQASNELANVLKDL